MNTRLFVLIGMLSLYAFVVAGCGKSDTPDTVPLSNTPGATLAPTPPSKTDTPDVGPLIYPGAQELAVAADTWDDAITVPCWDSDEKVLQRTAWRTEDLSSKIHEYYTKEFYDDNWELVPEPYSCGAEPWKILHYRKGYDVVALAIVGDLASYGYDVTLSPHVPGLRPSDSLVLMATGNRYEGYLQTGRRLLEERSDWETAKRYAEIVLQDRIQSGAGPDDAYASQALVLLAEALGSMSPVDAAGLWLQDAVNTNVFGTENDEALNRMRRLGLVREYPSQSDVPIIDTYRPTGVWTELSNDDQTALMEFQGVARADMTNRLLRTVEVEQYDYLLRVTLNRDEDNIWQVSPSSVVAGPLSAQSVAPPVAGDVPSGSIAIDGSPGDWSDIDKICNSDPQHDRYPNEKPINDAQAESSIDIKNWCIYVDEDWIYALMELYGPPSAGYPETGTTAYILDIRGATTDDPNITAAIFATLLSNGNVSGDIRYWGKEGQRAIPIHASFQGDFVEWAVPRQEVENLLGDGGTARVKAFWDVDYDPATAAINGFRPGDDAPDDIGQVGVQVLPWPPEQQGSD